MKHQKHVKLTKPNQGFFTRNEISFLGSNCNRIQQIAMSIGNSLNSQFDIGYVDADHASHDNESTASNPTFNREFTDKISYHQFDVHPKSTGTQLEVFFNDCDLVLVNGNHERGNNQIVIIDPNKEASLKKRAASLTNVIALIGIDSKEIPAYVYEIVPNANDLPIFLEENQRGISAFVEQFMASRIPPVKGLILGGGKSTRMGIDKLTMDYHGTSQLNYLKDLLKPVSSEVFVSLTKNQEIENTIIDTFIGLGPYGGILSAFQKDPNAAWFTVPCDVPLLDKKTIELLVSKRNPSKVATCFYNSETKFPEPLITIWEPRAYPVLLQFLANGYSCPRKVLINTDVEVVKLADESVLMNANTIEDRDLATSLLSKLSS